ncbi:MAG: hypothetical protein M3O70_24780 [Actinomycetota bacterium]|nr:hypothetical protein [Actinomycetota bacterium]
MQPAGIVTLIGVALTVVALAAYLTRVVLILRHVNFTVGTIVAALWAIVNQTEPLRQAMNDITGELNEIQSSLDGLLKERLQPAPPREAASPRRGRQRRSRATPTG